jgi:uncharacterized membrane protein (DUF2068 family)
MEKKRPILITVICILGFIGAAVAIPMIFSDISRSIGAWYPPYLAFGAVIGLICMIGLWMMKKWSIIVYTAFFVVNQVVFLAMGVWTILALLIPVIVIAIGFSQFSKMD